MTLQRCSANRRALAGRPTTTAVAGAGSRKGIRRLLESVTGAEA